MSQGDSNYKMVKDGWGSRPNFQASYGLNMNPSGIAKGNKILDAFRQADAKSSQQGMISYRSILF